MQFPSRVVGTMKYFITFNCTLEHDIRKAQGNEVLEFYRILKVLIYFYHTFWYDRRRLSWCTKRRTPVPIGMAGSTRIFYHFQSPWKLYVLYNTSQKMFKWQSSVTVKIGSTCRHIRYRSMETTDLEFGTQCRSLTNIMAKLHGSTKPLVCSALDEWKIKDDE
jgi:hypothetical protein